HARVEVPHRLERVVAGLSRRVAPFRLRRVEASRLPHVARAAHRHADTLMAADAEALLAMTARAALHRETAFHRVHVEVVARVDVPRAHAPVVAADAEIFLVTVRA